MTSKRKADLQRKLSMASVPKPPDGLADRIKHDIPEFLGTRPERQRFSKLLSVNMRVAASILLLVSSMYICLQILSHNSNENDRLMNTMVMARQAAKSMAVSNGPPPVMHEPVVAPNAPPVTTQPVGRLVAPPSSVAERIALHRENEVSDAKEEQRKDLDATTAHLEQLRDTNSVSGAAAAPAIAAAPPPPAPAAETGSVMSYSSYDAIAPRAEAKKQAKMAAAPPAEAPSMQQTLEKAAPTEMIRSANAAALNLRARDSVFGFSVDASAFEHVKSAIERGEHPTNVDVEALINYFAGPARRAPREVSLEAEGSSAPVDAGGGTVFVRYTIDTARDDVAPHASVPPIATNARVEITFDARAVASYRRVDGKESTSASESSLLKNVSVTALYAVQLQSDVGNRFPVATVVLHYRNVTNGREETTTRTLRVGDVTRPWTQATRRHRLASLGAVFGEQLKSATSGAEVARRAEELSRQEPKDERAKELAALANASSR
jgi:hypothetical protein